MTMPSDSRRACLLDTNVVIWLGRDTSRIRGAVLQQIADPNVALYVSTASFWELALKQTAGKFDPRMRFDDMLKRHGMRELMITSRYMPVLRDLPLLHRDPFDRMLVAQAITDSLILVTADKRLARYPVATLQV